MASVIELDAHRRRRSKRTSRPSPTTTAAIVTCCQCHEPHPIARLPGGEPRCVTAFFDGTHWFCRNRGCRRAWLDRAEE